MAFLPFYMPGKGRLRVVIVGGGYAGVAALVTLLRHRPDAEVTVVDPRSRHIKVTHLHETFRRPLRDFLVPFEILAQRFGCRHVCAELAPSGEDLQRWQQDKAIVTEHETLEFDYVLLASGAGHPPAGRERRILTLADFFERSGTELLDDRLDLLQGADSCISVIGGGATGMQFLFEIAQFVRSRGLPCKQRLIDSEDRVLKQFGPDFSRYAQARMADWGVEHLPNTFYQGQKEGMVVVEDRESGGMSELPSEVSFLFPGQRPANWVTTNLFGQVMVEERVQPNIFAAGDCSRYAGLGSNSVTAQSAVRKGKLAARNILRHSGILPVLEPYLHRDLGYVVSLGPDDAVGWLALEGNVVGGVPALVIKELVEAQYDLLLAGIDTYLI